VREQHPKLIVHASTLVMLAPDAKSIWTEDFRDHGKAAHEKVSFL
jgi:hypothetical protein